MVDPSFPGVVHDTKGYEPLENQIIVTWYFIYTIPLVTKFRNCVKGCIVINLGILICL